MMPFGLIVFVKSNVPQLSHCEMCQAVSWEAFPLHVLIFTFQTSSQLKNQLGRVVCCN